MEQTSVRPVEATARVSLDTGSGTRPQDQANAGRSMLFGDSRTLQGQDAALVAVVTDRDAWERRRSRTSFVSLLAPPRSDMSSWRS